MVIITIHNQCIYICVTITTKYEQAAALKSMNKIVMIILHVTEKAVGTEYQ